MENQMATKLRKFDFTAPSTITTAEKPAYPWGDWFDGDIWEIRYGDDFLTHPLMMERTSSVGFPPHPLLTEDSTRHQRGRTRFQFGSTCFCISASSSRLR